MDITCYRDQERGCELRYLPASTYNLAITLLADCPDKNLFVPVRSMQYMAILDGEEFVFLDGERKCWVDIAWRRFRPQMRDSLTEPVQYEAVYYLENAASVMMRLQREFPLALKVLADRMRHNRPSATIIRFP